MSPAAADELTVTWEGHGSDELPCDGTLHWILTAHSATSATLDVEGEEFAGEKSGEGAFHFTTPGEGVDASSNVFATYEADSEEPTPF